MRVLIVNTKERTGGAAVAASRLTEALNNNGVKAKMLVMEKQSSALWVVGLNRWLQGEWNFLYERVLIWVNCLFSRKNLFKVSIANTGTDITRLPEFKEADVIHLHWVNQGFLSRKGIRKIIDSGKPVVWTMHDMWPLTGICHHAYTCEHFSAECGDCPFLRLHGSHDLSNRVFRRKQKMLEGAIVHFTAVSNWLAEKARQSALTGRQPITVIPNLLPLAHFTLIDRTDARSTLGIQAPYVVAFGAARMDDPIKGFEHLLATLQRLTATGKYGKEDIHLLLFGGLRDEALLKQIPVAYTYLGYVNDSHLMSEIYSAANAVVSSSYYETFGQTLIEAMACGCTPVSFDGSGQTDIISHRQTGFLAKHLDDESLAEGIDWALQARLEPLTLRRHVLRYYGEINVAQQYIKLYESALNHKRPLARQQ